MSDSGLALGASSPLSATVLGPVHLVGTLSQPGLAGRHTNKPSGQPKKIR